MKGTRVAVAGMLAAASMGGIGIAQTAAPQGAAPAPAPAPAPKTWVDWVTFKGDLRYRYETRNDDSKLNADNEEFTRELNRVRARLGAEAKVNDKTKAGIEFSTGQSDPVSGNQSLTDGFGKKEFRLNLAYLEYSFLGDSANEVKAIGGKMKNPFINVGDLVWDGDATPEGVVAKGFLTSRHADLMGNAGYLWLQERSSDKDDSMLYAGQGAVKVKFVPEVSLTVGATYYGFEKMEGYDVIDWERANNSYGNSTQSGSVSKSGGVTTTNKAWKTEFTPIEFFAALEVWVLGRPLTVIGQTVSNPEADDLDVGHQYGVTYGKAKNPGTFEVGYWFAELEKDAVPGFLTDSDRWGGGTDGSGHKFAAKYQVMKNLQAGITYFLGEKKISDPEKTTDYDRLQVDLIASF